MSHTTNKNRKRKEEKPKLNSFQETIHWSLGFPNARDSQEIMQERAKIQSKQLEQYEEMKSNFIQEEVSQQSQVLLRRMANNQFVASKYNYLQMLEILNYVYQELLLNELELTV